MHGAARPSASGEAHDMASFLVAFSCVASENPGWREHAALAAAAMIVSRLTRVDSKVMRLARFG